MQRTFDYDARSRLTAVRDTSLQFNFAQCDGIVDPNNGVLCQTPPLKTFVAVDSLGYSAVGNQDYVAGMPAPVYSRNRLTSWPRFFRGSPLGPAGTSPRKRARNPRRT